MLPYSDTLSWFRANRSLLCLNNAASFCGLATDINFVYQSVFARLWFDTIGVRTHNLPHSTRARKPLHHRCCQFQLWHGPWHYVVYERVNTTERTSKLHFPSSGRHLTIYDAWLIDWLIVCCLMSSGKWLLHIQDDNKFNNIITKIYRKWGRNVITATTTIDWHRKHTVSVGIISPVSGFPQHDNPRLIEMTPSMCHLGTQLKLYF
jgi:hypothetical protein